MEKLFALLNQSQTLSVIRGWCTIKTVTASKDLFASGKASYLEVITSQKFVL